MSDEPRDPEQGERPRNEGRSMLHVLLISGGVIALIFLAASSVVGPDSAALSLDDFLRRVERNEVERVEFQGAAAEVKLRGGDLSGEEGSRRRRLNFIDREHANAYADLVRQRKSETGLGPEVRARPADDESRFFIYLISGLLLLGAIYYIFLRPLRLGPGGGLMSFGRSRHRLIDKKDSTVRLSDVAGCEEAKAEVQEIIQYLRDPEKFRRLGARIPKGVLLVGAPGTGKTLLAKAAAGEAGVKFFVASGSDFVEMFAGVGASRARDLFKSARESAPCILFLDEIDAVGRQRGGSFSGAHDERDQTLNQILVEMDGFPTDAAVIVMAATNRPDILDSALTRPGRFDRKIILDLPDVDGRLAILGVHAARRKVAEGIDLSVIARATPGFSGAELEALVNEAALAAALKDKEAIEHEDFEEARDKVRWGRQKRSRAMDPDDLEATAWHEAGHALVAISLPECDPVHKVTIIPRGMALGATMSLPAKDVVGLRKRQVLAKIALCYGGRLGELLITDDLSTGAANDLEQATQLARKMVTEWGMAEDVGPAAFTGDSGGPLPQRLHSERTAQAIDEAVRRILEQEYRRAEELIAERRPALERIAKALLQRETLTGDEVKALADGAEPDSLSEPEAPPPAQPPEA